MSNSKVVASLAETIAAHVANVTSTEATALKIAADAVEAVGKARNHALTSLVALWEGQAPVNDVSFNATIKQPMFDAYVLTNAFKNDATVKNRMHFDKACIIAITNNILPVAGETLQVFAKRIGPTLKTTQGVDGKPLYTPATGSSGGRKAKESTPADVASKGIEMSLNTALNVVAKGNLADREMFQFFIDNIDKARMAYGMLNPIKIK